MKSEDSYWDGRLEERHLILSMLRYKQDYFEALSILHLKAKNFEAVRLCVFRANICDDLAQSIEREEHVK